MRWRRLIAAIAAATTLAVGGFMSAKSTPARASYGPEVVIFIEGLYGNYPVYPYDAVTTFCIDGDNQYLQRVLGCFPVNRNNAPPAGITFSNSCWCYWWFEGSVNIAGYNQAGNQVTWNGGVWIGSNYSGDNWCIDDRGYSYGC